MSAANIAWVAADGSITRGTPDSTGATGIESESFDKILARVGNEIR